MDLLVPVIPVLLEIDFVTHDEPCSQYRHSGCVIAAVCPSTSSRWIVAATAPGVAAAAAAKVVMEAGTEFLL